MVIMLVAVFMLFVVGAMAALAIDLVTLYTARSEAQLAADGAALAGARVLANSGMTSDTNAAFDGLMANAELLATTIAKQVATHQNEVGGRTLNPAEVTVTFNDAEVTNPRVTVQTKRTDLPTFFARLWGNTALTVSASATAEAYNPSGMNALGKAVIPVAPLCVKPWLLPNIDPTQAAATGAKIFDANGAIVNPGLLGLSWQGANPNNLSARCGDCSAGAGGILLPLPGQYYPGAIDAGDFPAPTQALPIGSAGFNPYKLAVAGCVQQPISCGAAATLNIDVTGYGPTRDADTFAAASLLMHYKGGVGNTDSIDTAALPSPPPFQFLGGNQNPVANAIATDVLVSDSLVTIPVIDTPGSPPPAPTNPVTVIGFLQVFLNPTGNIMVGPQIPATIVNMAGCGPGAAGPPILGNGASPVAVRLISSP